MRFHTWLERALTLRLLITLPILLLTLIPLTLLLTRFFLLPPSIVMLINALLITLTLWLQRPMAFIPRLSREALATLRETSILREEIEREALRIAHTKDQMPSTLILTLTLIFTLSWILTLTTVHTTITDVLTSLGIIPGEETRSTHATGFDIPYRTRAAITGSEGESSIQAALLTQRIHPDILRASSIEPLTLQGGGLASGTQRESDTTQQDGSIRIIRVSNPTPLPDTDPSIIRYYQLISTK